MDQPSALQPRPSLMSFNHEMSRAESVRLHGFRQKRALRQGGLKSNEALYLKFAAAGDVEMVKKQFATYSSDQLNKNCTDYFERTALVLAITNGHQQMVKLLLRHNVELTESLFYAIDTEFIEAVEAILKHNRKRREQYKDMLITSQESIFPRFLSPIMLAAHNNNYEILELLYNNGHRLRDFSLSASNKWDEMRLKWQYYRAKASEAYMILMYNKESVDPLNEAIEFYGELKREGNRAREVREDYKKLSIQCEDFAIALLDQIRTAQELADLLRFCLVDRDFGNANELVLTSLPALLNPGSSHDELNVPNSRDSLSDVSDTASLNWVKSESPQIHVSDASSDVSYSRDASPRFARLFNDNTAELIRNYTDTKPQTSPKQLSANASPVSTGKFQGKNLTIEMAQNSNALDQRLQNKSLTLKSVPEGRRRTLGFRRSKKGSVDLEYARPIHFLKPIEKAVNYGMVRLVTCQNAQLALTYLKDGLMFRDIPNPKRFFKKLLVSMFFPLISMAFLIFPDSEIGLISRNPTAKLWMEVTSDIYLILILILNLILTGSGVFGANEFSPLLILAYFWMLGKFINLIFLAYHQRSRVMYSIWNWNDLASITCYTIFVCLRIYNGSTNRIEVPDQWSAIPLSDMFMSVVYILVFLRPLEILRVNRVFGPLQVSIDKMMGDVMKFFVIFMFFWFAFSCGINTLMWRYGNGTASEANASKSLCRFAGDEKFVRLVDSLEVHFWSIFGYSDDYKSWFDLQCREGDRVITALFGEIVFALYHIATVLVLVNMLIAIMSGTLQKTTGENDIQWHFHRTRVWIRFIRTGFYRPPPLNLIPRPKEIVFGFRLICNVFRGKCRRGSKYFVRRHESTTTETSFTAAKPNSELGNESGAATNGIEQYQYKRRRSLDVGDPRPRGSVISVEEFHTRYDVALRKCVKRYLKTHVLQSSRK